MKTTRIFTESCSREWPARCVCSRLGLLLLLTMVCVATARAAQIPPKPGSPPADLPGHVNYLAKQLYGMPLDESEPLTSEIQNLVLTHMQQWLADHGAQETPSSVQVRREMEQAFAQIQYPLYAWPAVFAQSWKGETLYGVGYTLGWSDYDRANVVALFETGQKKVRLAAVTHFVPHTDLHYQFMRPMTGSEFRFIVYGTRLGKSQRRLTAALYSFDGQALRSLWQLQDAYDGRIRVVQDSMTIRYMREDEYVRETARGRKPPRYEAIYKATPQGLELNSSREIPFSSEAR